MVKLALLRDPAIVQIAPVSATTAMIQETVYRVERHDKPALLAHLVRSLPAPYPAGVARWLADEVIAAV